MEGGLEHLGTEKQGVGKEGGDDALNEEQKVTQRNVILIHVNVSLIIIIKTDLILPNQEGHSIRETLNCHKINNNE